MNKIKKNNTQTNNLKRNNITQSRRDLRNLIARWKQNMVCERVFSIIQCVKLLNHFNLSYSDLIDTTKVSQYMEKTQGFSYYVLTSIFMVFLSELLEVCATQYSSAKKEENKVTINFLKTEENYMRYTDIVKNNYSSDIMLKSTSVVENQLKVIGETSPLLNTNLRMSLLEA